MSRSSRTSRSRPGTLRAAGAGSSASGGFTLIEVLVSVAVSAVILTALYATFFSVFRAADASEAGLDKRIEAGRVLDRLGRDVRSVYFDPNTPATRFAGVRENGRMELGFAAFSRANALADTPSSDIVGVRYFVAPGETFGQVEPGEGGTTLSLYRESWDFFTGDRARVELLTNVADFGVSFFNGRDWSGAWDSTFEGGPPRAVRIEVELADGERLRATARVMVR